jgi:regulatory protein
LVRLVQNIMKIIKPLRSASKGDSSNASETNSTETSEGEQHIYSHKVKAKSSIDENTLKSKQWKPRSKKKYGPTSERRSKLPNDYKSSLDNAESEEQYEFDTSKLEAMPKDEVFEGPSKGKTRRRSELQAEKASEPLTLVIDPAQKEFNDVFARGLRLLAMREHSVKELTTKLFARFEASQKAQGSEKAEGSNDSEGADTVNAIEEADNADVSNVSQGSDVIYAVIDDLLEKKYLSDERFTEVYIRSRCIRGFGPTKIKAELKSKGVSNNLIQDYLDPGGAIWFDNAQTQYQKKYGDAPITDYSAWSKRARFMQSRGFTMEQIQVTVPQFSSD